MHTIEFLLKTTKDDKAELDKRFFNLFLLHNQLVKRAVKLIRRLDRDKDYQALRERYHLAKELCGRFEKDKFLSKQLKEDKKDAAQAMNDIRAGIGLSQSGLESYIKKSGKNKRHMLSSQQVQKEAKRVWQGVEKCLFGDGKKLHYKKLSDTLTISQKSAVNGVKFDREDYSVDYLGLRIRCKVPRTVKNPGSKPSRKDRDFWYAAESLDHKVRYCELKRRMFNNGWHYYVTIYLEGGAPEKLKAGKNTMGIDPGVSSMAGVSKDKAVLFELAPKSKEYNKKISRLQRKMDRSRRAMNPDNYHEDGTVKKSRRTWEKSGSYKKDERRLKTLYRQKSEYIEDDHRRDINLMLLDSNSFNIERMDYKALQKRAKKKDGDKPNKRRRRFGRSLNDRAPSLFISILEQKAGQYGGEIQEIDPRTYKGSQYCHDTGTCTKVPLSQREKEVAGHMVQRDLYSAYLQLYPGQDLKCPDRDALTKNFDNFIKIQDELIRDMKEKNISMKQCFGF